jgi:cell division protein FtsB
MALLDGQLTSLRFQTTVRWTLVVALWALLMSMGSGQSGIANYVELVNKRNVLADVNIRLKIENQNLEQKIHSLQTSTAEQLRFLKEEFGYVQPGEFIYRFENEKSRPKPAETKRPSHTTDKQNAHNPNG